MKYYQIYIDDLPLTIVRDNHTRLSHWRDPGKMALEIARIATKHPHWHITFEEVEIPDETSPIKQVMRNHPVLHNPNISWQKCSDPSCVKLQIAVQEHARKKESANVT